MSATRSFDVPGHPIAATLGAMNAPAQSSDSPARSRGGLSRVAQWVGGLLFLYVLSVGPVAKLVDTGHVAEASVAPFYAPIVWLIDHWQPAQDATIWYLTVIWGIDVYHK